MSTIVMIISSQGGSYFANDEGDAKRLFGDLIEKTQASKILTLRADSSDVVPKGISDLSENLGIECVPVQIDRFQPQFWVNVDPKIIWSEYLQTIIVNSPINSEEEDLCFMINSAMGFQAALMYSMYEMLGGSLWVTEGELNQDLKATRLDRSTPDEQSLGKSVLAGICEFNISNSGSGPTSSEIQGLSSIPPSKGIENTLRQFTDYFIDKQQIHEDKKSALEAAKEMFEKEDLEHNLSEGLEKARENNDKYSIKHFQEKIKSHENRIKECEQAFSEPHRWVLNPLGRYNANLVLAESWKSLGVSDGPQGLIIFVRSVSDSKNVVEYLKQHRAALPYDKYAFVIGGINVSNSIEISKLVHQEASNHLGSSDVVSSPEEVCFNIDSDGNLLTDSSRVMEILHGIRQDNDGIEWSIDITGVLGLLRPAVFQYAGLADISTIYISKNPRQKVAGGVIVSGLAAVNHLLSLPDKSDIKSIKDALNNRKLACFIGTLYDFYRKHPESAMGIEKKPFGDNRPYHYNRLTFVGEHKLRMQEMERSHANKSMNKWLEEAAGAGLVYQSGRKNREIRLTPTGVIVGALLVS